MKRGISLALLILMMMICNSALGQTTQGRILGNVTDQTGAVISAAKITITNTETGISRETTSATSGDYLVSALQPGLYRITVEAPAFKKAERTGIRVEVAKDVRLDMQLQPGAVTESVTIT